jgi:cyclopropane fatty-acyl-phospholipid synthase-like methyltransferase
VKQYLRHLAHSLREPSSQKHTQSKPDYQSRLDGDEWHQAIIYPGLREEVLDRLQRKELSLWGKVVMETTAPGEKVLEIGSGTGEISLALALAGRVITVLDISAESLAFTQQCAEVVGVQVETIQADAMQPFSIADNTFDCTWSSGLLEHFTVAERHLMLAEQSRITRGRVLSLVPNAACLAYRIGKEMQEAEGTWLYGVEVPLLSLRDEFAQVGLQVLPEFSVGAHHALNFLPVAHPLRKELACWMADKSEETLRTYQQGYLLVTIGVKNGEVVPC